MFFLCPAKYEKSYLDETGNRVEQWRSELAPRYGLGYTEFICPMIKAVQQMDASKNIFQGNVSIGRDVGDTARVALDVSGELYVSGDITAFKASDIRLKTNLNKIENPILKLAEINGYTFDWVEKEGIHTQTGRDIGVIAQEIETVLPEITVTRDNGYKAVKYEKLAPLLIECVKTQQEQLNKQQKDFIIIIK